LNIKQNILQSKLDNLPVKPGVYQFKDSAGKVIYVGKAKSLKSRVRQYFHTRPQNFSKQIRTETMISKIADIELITTDTEVEALILEFNLIKELKPRYNVDMKDDKTFPYIVITDEVYPRVFPTRKKRTDKSAYFGPFTDVKNMRYALKSVRDIFMIRSCSLKLDEENVKTGKFKICLDYHIHKCDGPCENLVSRADYNETVNQVAKLLNGKTKTLENELRVRMDEYSEKMMFEQAGRLRDKIDALAVYNSRQKMTGEEIIDRDIFAVECEDNDACGMVLKIRDGRVIGKSHYYMSGVLEKPEEEILDKLITNYYAKAEFIPDEIFVPVELENAEAIKEWLCGKKRKDSAVVSIRNEVDIIVPKIGDKAKLIAMVASNARLMLGELKLAKLKREFIAPSVEALKRDLRLNKLPRRIECFDISHLQGTETVASMVVFQDGKPRKTEYRKYKINSVLNEIGTSDDFLSMREVIHRRFRRLLEEKGNPPDLVIVDGGKGQLSSAVKSLTDLGFKVNTGNPSKMFAPVKGPDSAGSTLPDKQTSEEINYEQPNINIIGLAKRLEEIYFPNDSDSHTVPKTSSGLKLLQRIRDEAHRFAVEFHRSLRDKRTLRSELNTITNIGEKTALKLLREYGSFEGVKTAITAKNSADTAKLEKTAGKRATAALKEYFNF
jgi:excinuclease ABC subunit C